MDPKEPSDWMVFLVVFTATLGLLWLFFAWIGAPAS